MPIIQCYMYVNYILRRLFVFSTIYVCQSRTAQELLNNCSINCTAVCNLCCVCSINLSVDHVIFTNTCRLTFTMTPIPQRTTCYRNEHPVYHYEHHYIFVLVSDLQKLLIIRLYI